MESIQRTKQLVQVMDNVLDQTNVFAQISMEALNAIVSNVLALLVTTQKFALDLVHVSVIIIVLAFQIIFLQIVH